MLHFLCVGKGVYRHGHVFDSIDANSEPCPLNVGVMRSDVGFGRRVRCCLTSCTASDRLAKQDDIVWIDAWWLDGALFCVDPRRVFRAWCFTMWYQSDAMAVMVRTWRQLWFDYHAHACRKPELRWRDAFSDMSCCAMCSHCCCVRLQCIVARHGHARSLASSHEEHKKRNKSGCDRCTPLQRHQLHLHGISSSWAFFLYN